MPMPEDSRPILPYTFYSDRSFFEGLVDITHQFTSGRLLAGQKRTFPENTFLRNLQPGQYENCAIGDIQIAKLEVRNDRCAVQFGHDYIERYINPVKLSIKIRCDNQFLTKEEGKFFLTVPDIM